MDSGDTMKELDLVVLQRDVPERGLRQGDVGVVVHQYADGLAGEIEFSTGDGSTIAVLTLPIQDVRPVGDREILHAREIIPG
jgi:hypothetical protein